MVRDNPLTNTTNTNNMLKDYQTRENRLKRKDPSADFRLADNDDFFGFDPKATGVSFRTLALWAVAIGLAVSAWTTLGRMQAKCLELNGGDITKCE